MDVLHGLLFQGYTAAGSKEIGGAVNTCERWARNDEGLATSPLTDLNSITGAS